MSGHGVDGKFAAALVAAQGKMKALVKDKASYVAKFVSTERVIQESKEVLSECGLAVVAVGSQMDKGELVDVENKEGMIVQRPSWTLRTTFHVVHESGFYQPMSFDMAVIPEKGKPLDKAVASASTFSWGYFLRGLLMIPRVGSEQEVDERDDRNFDPSRLTHREITDKLAHYQKTLGKQYVELAGTEPPESYEAAIELLDRLKLHCEMQEEIKGKARTFAMLLSNLGGTDDAKKEAILLKNKLPALEEMRSASSAKLSEAIKTLTAAWKGESK